jgi:hypothetical protein
MVIELFVNFDPLHHQFKHLTLSSSTLWRYYLKDSIKVVLIGTIIIFIDSSGFNNVPLGKYNVISISWLRNLFFKSGNSCLKLIDFFNLIAVFYLFRSFLASDSDFPLASFFLMIYSSICFFYSKSNVIEDYICSCSILCYFEIITIINVFA